jgi:arylsulfatase A-like enzyme
MIIRWPRTTPPGSVCSTPVSSVDLMPTIMDIANVPVDARPDCDGLGLAPLLDDTGGYLRRDAIYWHYPHYHHTAPAGAIREGDLKLIEYFEDGRLELYNLAEDVGEQNDLSAAMPGRARQLRQRLREWRDLVGARMPRRNPNHDPARAHEWHRRPR